MKQLTQKQCRYLHRKHGEVRKSFHIGKYMWCLKCNRIRESINDLLWYSVS